MLRVISKQVFAESLVVTVDPSITQIPLQTHGDKTVYGDQEQIIQIARQVIRRYYSNIDPHGDKFMSGRYIFHVAKISNYYDGLTLTVRFLPKNRTTGQEKPLNPEDPMYDHYMSYRGGKSGKTVYKTPKDAVKEIPSDPNSAYRGMAWEEWQSIRKSGFIASRGVYNLGEDQVNLTLFAPDPATALHYANGFAPIQYQISQKRPGVVISVPREGLLTHKEYPQGVPAGELGLKGKMSSSKIQSVWMMTVTESDDKGFMEFIIPWVPAWNKSNDRDPLMGVFKLDSSHVRGGSGRTQVVTGYAIRRLM